MNDSRKMKWQKDLDTFFPIYNTFIFTGHIDDDQPCDEADGSNGYCRLHEYFEKMYNRNEQKELRKRVIIYDPTESQEKRFTICGEDNLVPTRMVDAEGNERETVSCRSVVSQHFWDILHSDQLNESLIDHRSTGVSLDFSRIHYAVTENSARLNRESQRGKLGEGFAAVWDMVANAFNSLVDDGEPSGYLFVIKMTSRLLSSGGSRANLSDEELMLFRQLLSIAQSMDSTGGVGQNSKLMILANKAEDLPAWFVDETANPFIKIINVSKPSEENKLEFFWEMIGSPSCFTDNFIARFQEMDAVLNANADDPAKRKRTPIEKKFLAYTNDFGMRMLRRYRAYLEHNPLDNPDKLGFSINTFRLGDMTNPWDDPEIIKEMLNVSETVGRKIKGQRHALSAAQAILTRAAIGLDRAENPNAPRVVLFLAGPTGTGKTELCKQLAECVFGSEDRIVRFDMSEYGQAESDQKLFGAPPGYVGYEEGGKLTNAIKKEPFSLILFDEIEKANDSILDKFLQILGDGRLTDGKGETVRFTDCIIVITSNAGVNKLGGLDPAEKAERMGDEVAPDGVMNMSAVEELERQLREAGRVNEDGSLTEDAEDEIYNAVSAHLRYNVKEYFHCALGRPELYGRIEDSIVYYNYIGSAAVYDIVRGKINSVIRSAIEEKGLAGIECPDEVLQALARYCRAVKVRALGARGIIKNTGRLFTGSLSNYLSPYVRQVDGMSEEQLYGRTLICSCEGEISSPDDIHWDFVNDGAVSAGIQ